MKLFMALWPPRDAVAATEAAQNAWQWSESAKRVAPAKLHLTLHFLGEVDAARVPALAAGTGVRFDAFDLRFGRNELWPRGTAVCLPLQVPVELVALHAGIGEVLRALGVVVPARDFRPHLTWARHADGSKPPAVAPGFRWSIRSYALMQSEGGRYRPIARFDAD